MNFKEGDLIRFKELGNYGSVYRIVNENGTLMLLGLTSGMTYSMVGLELNYYELVKTAPKFCKLEDDL